MTGIVAWFARNHVAANLLMALLIVGGLITLPGIEQRVFPEISLDIVNIRVAYPGASPSEVEEAICIRIEQEIHGLSGVKTIHSTASEGYGNVTVELLLGEDVQRRLDDIRSRIDAITSFPDEAEKPIVSQVDVKKQVIYVAVSGHVDERTLKRVGEQVRDEITALPGITDVQLAAMRPYEIAIEVSENALLRHNLSFDDVVRAVQSSSLDMPGGSLKTRAGEILLRTKGQAYRGDEFERLVLVSRPDGTRLTVGDVATVIDGFEETDLLARFDQAPAAMIEVFRVGQQSALAVSQTVRDYVSEANARMPEGITLTPWQDDSRLLRDRLSTVLRNARSGFILVVLVLSCFLRLRLSLWVSLGIPISFLGALWVMPHADVHIDLFSLMAFIVVLGIVVDDAIIIGESIHTEQSRSRDRLAAAIRGAHAVSTPVIFGVLTTIIAFVPMLFVPGPMGKITRIIPTIVILCLVFSLIESLFILPAHLGHGHAGNEGPPRFWISRNWRRFQDRVTELLQGFIDGVYLPLLERAIEWRYLTVACGATLFLVTAAMLGGGHLRFVFIPAVEGDTIGAFLAMPEGTSPELTLSALRDIEAALTEVRAQIASEGRGEHAISHVQLTVGDQPLARRQAGGPAAYTAASRRGSHLGEVGVEMAPPGLRDVSATEITERWRALIGDVPGAIELKFSSRLMTAGDAISLRLAGSNLAHLRAAAAFAKEQIAGYPGVVDLRDSFRDGAREVELEILPSAEALGLTQADLARQVRQAFYGHEVQRIQRGRDDVGVVVRYPAADRQSLADLEQMRIRTSDGSAVPFSAVANATMTTGFSTIRRVDRRRVITVTAGVDAAIGNANEILEDVRKRLAPELAQIFPSVTLSFEGENREQREVLGALLRGWAVALLAIYALLAIPLRSYLQPLIIMSAIPFGLIGAAWGHVLVGMPFSMFSILGLVALSGVVVNDSLVLVDYVNQCRARGVALADAVREAGRARFRAILLTSLTTFVGLTPLMLETSPQAKLLIPMGLSLAFGVAFATAITLILVPATYLIADDVTSIREHDPAAGAVPEPAKP